MSSKVHQQATTLKKPKDSKRTSAPPSQCMGIISSFPIIQEAPKHGKSSSTEATLSARRQKSSELKFKIESIGTQLEEDDDLDMCPARTRSSWPHQIVPWWKPSHPREKPPYSYATLIAHAILSSKDGRLTLSDIYKWISEHYPYYVLGQHGWQNSIRHNLSLNKKWFLKLDRRPTQANPGKGCYWTLIAGTEQIFIDNLTQAGGHSRKHHDIGLTAELSIGNQRRGSYGPQQQQSAATSLDSAPDMVITRPEDYASKDSRKKPVKMSPLYTTFRMSCNVSTPSKQNKRENGSLHKKRQSKKQKQQTREQDEDSDCDSGVDVGNEYVEPNNKKCLPSQESDQWAALLDMPWSVEDWLLPVAAATTTTNNNNNDDALAFQQPPAPIQEDNGTCTGTLLDHTTMLPWDDTGLTWQPQDTIQSQTYPTLLASRYDPQDYQLQHIQNTEEQVEDCLKELLKFQEQQQHGYQQGQQQQQQYLRLSRPPKRANVTIDLLNDDEVTQKYLHFDDDSNEYSYADDEDDEFEASATHQQQSQLQQQAPQVSVHHDFDDFPLDTPSSILQQHHEFASMRELLYSKI